MKNYLKIIKNLFLSSKLILIITFICILIGMICEMAIPIGINKLISMLEISPSINIFAIGIGIFVIAYFLICVISAINTRLYMKIGSKLLWVMREKIYHVLWKADYLRYVQKDKDKFKFVLSDQTYTAFAIAVVYTISGFANMLTVISFIGVTFYYSIVCGIVLVISIALTLLVSFVTGRSVLDGYEICNNLQEKDSAQIYETVDLVEATRTNGLQKYLIKKNKEIHNEFMNASENADSKSAFCEAIENGLNCIIYIIIAGVLLLDKKSIGGEIVTVLFVTNIALDMSHRVQRQLQVIIKNIPVFANVIELMEIPLEGGDEISSIKEISIENVGLSIDNRIVFDNLTEEIKCGDNVLIKGENGSGKSSLLKMLVGLYQPTSGRILINGNDIKTYDYSSLYNEICYISQEEMMLSESVGDYLRNVTHTKLDENEIENARKTVTLNKEIERIEENGATLSGGEKKKLFMMKCLLSKNVSMVIVDEIDAGLDAETKSVWKKIEESIKSDDKKILLKISHIDTDESGFNHIIQL